MAKTEMSKDIDYDGLIEDLVQKIDNEKSLFTLRDELHGYGMALFIVGLYLFLGFIVWTLPNSVVSLVEKLTFLVAILAVMLTFVSFISEDLKDNVVDANFRKAIKKFNIDKKEEEKRLLLRALLKTKAMNPNSKLGIVKKMHKDVFTKEMLLERLYEQPK